MFYQPPNYANILQQLEFDWWLGIREHSTAFLAIAFMVYAQIRANTIIAVVDSFDDRPP